jgi:hypothetical protein
MSDAASLAGFGAQNRNDGMPPSDASYDQRTLAMLTQAFDAAWRELQKFYPDRSAKDLLSTRKMMALRIMTAIRDGENEPARLCTLALRAVDGRDFG